MAKTPTIVLDEKNENWLHSMRNDKKKDDKKKDDNKKKASIIRNAYLLSESDPDEAARLLAQINTRD